MCAALLRGIFLVSLLTLAYGCTQAATRSATAPNRHLEWSSADITGVWQGKSFADCPIVTTDSPGRCGAMQLITLTLFQQGSRVSGSYKCAYGNENCRDLAETGVIRHGEMSARLLRIAVMLEDGSLCRFTGRPENGILQGRYQCHWGGPLEQGAFRVERSY